jgi:hypothetical protein
LVEKGYIFAADSLRLFHSCIETSGKSNILVQTLNVTTLADIRAERLSVTIENQNTFRGGATHINSFLQHSNVGMVNNKYGANIWQCLQEQTRRLASLIQSGNYLGFTSATRFRARVR